MRKGISIDLFNRIIDQYGQVASWAIWEKPSETPKSNISKMELLDPQINPNLLSQLTTDVIFIGLNFSRETSFPKPFMNFHDSYSRAHDYKIRFALDDTPYMGSYMTDLIKNFPEIKSSNVIKSLKKNPSLVTRAVNDFAEELRNIESKDSMIFCFGKDVFDILSKHLDKSLYKNLINLTHYSHYIGQEEYREMFLNRVPK